MLSKSKQRDLLASLKQYNKQYLKKTNPDLDESGTRINSVLNIFLAA